MTTVPKSNNIGRPIQPPDASPSAPFTGKGLVNIGPPNIGIGPYMAEPITGLGKGKNVPAPPGAKPFTSK